MYLETKYKNNNVNECQYGVEIVENIEGLMRLRSEWEQIAETKKVEPWQSFNWIEAAATTYSRNHTLRIFTVRKNGKLTAVAPMVLKETDQFFKPMQYHILGGEEMKEPNRFIAGDEESQLILINAIAQEPVYPVRLSRIQYEKRVEKKLYELFKGAGWITKAMQMPCPYIELNGEGIKKSLQKDLKRAKKRAEIYGEIKYEIVKDGKMTDMISSLQKGFMIEASGWKGQNKTAILSNNNRKEFFEKFAESSFREGVLRLSFLYIGNLPVAFQYAVETNGSYWLLNIGYDERYRDCSPGNILLEESIQDAKKRGVKKYNLLGKQEKWTERWTEKSQKCSVISAYRLNVCGLISMISDAVFLMKKQKEKKMIQKIKDKQKTIIKNKTK